MNILFPLRGWERGMGGEGGPFLLRFLFLLTFAVFTLTAPLNAAPPVESRGTFVDGAGQKHPWRINAAHTLIWDDKPFVPVGGLFQARSWVSAAAAATETDWESDVAALKTLKTGGVTDVIVQPARGGITGVRPEAVQRLLDHLDSEGFTYGISLNDGPRDPLIGFVVRPGLMAHRQTPAANSGAVLRFPLADIGSSLFFIVNSKSGEMLEVGSADIVAEGARVTLPPIPGPLVAFLVPEKIYFPGNAALPVPNVWEGFDDYRDSVLALFSRVKPGKGFRFFVDALPSSMALTEDFDRFIPSSPAFAREWASWLSRRYRSVDALHTAWGVERGGLRSFAEAADLIPLWSGGKGVEIFYQRGNGVRHKAASTRSAFWGDLTAFKNESLRHYMHDLATALKRGVADAPVVYRSAGHSALFADMPAERGFDGIGIDAYGRGRDLITHSAGYGYAQAAEAPKTVWLPVTGTSDARDAAAKREKGYPSRAVLFSDLDGLREFGLRGFYVNGVRVADPERKNFDLSDAPEQIAWLGDYAQLVSTTLGTGDAALTKPETIFFPRAVTSITPRPLTGGGWWLPTDRPATLFDFGASGRAYALNEPEGVVYYFWNPAGQRTIRLRLPKSLDKIPNARPVSVSTSAKATVRKDILTLTVGPEPVRILNLPTLPVPMEAFEETAKEARALVAVARKRGLLEAEHYNQNIDRIERLYDKDDPLPKLNELLSLTETLRVTLRPYAWIEAEKADAHTFDEISNRMGASGGSVLLVSNRPTTASSATATFVLNVHDAGTYQIWAAATPDAPLLVRINGQPPTGEGFAPRRVGGSYAGGTLAWTHHGPVTLAQGQHRLEVRLDAGSGGSGSSAAIDALLLIPGDFTPNGVIPPPVLPSQLAGSGPEKKEGGR